jgi:hypothetical protein
MWISLNGEFFEFEAIALVWQLAPPVSPRHSRPLADRRVHPLLPSCASGKDSVEIAPNKRRLSSDEFADTAAFTLQGQGRV